MIKNIHKFGLYCALLLLFGCGSQPLKDSSQTILKNKKVVSDEAKNSLMFEKVNGQKLKIGLFTTPNKATHIVESGTKELSIKVTHTTNTTKVVWAAFLDVQVELSPGETYVIDANENDWCMEVFVKNLKGDVVAGPVYKALGPYLSYSHMQNASTMNLVKSRIQNTKCKS